MKNLLQTLLLSLNTLEVKGKNNLDVLLGCIVAIEHAIEMLEPPGEITVEDTEESNG